MNRVGKVFWRNYGVLVSVSAEDAVFVAVEFDLVLDSALEIDVDENFAVRSNARDHTTFIC